ncbi:MAG: hypothetical protein JWP97_4336 [Labilithrix sp.]|nr:hypothetical protein [Labilithrix sp.]
MRRVIPIVVALSAGCITAQDLGTHARDGGTVTPGDGGFDPFAPDAASSSSGASSSGASSSGSSGGVKLFFTTRAVFTGALGGLSGADAKCDEEARAAGLGGSFRAWLSTSTVAAKTRITGGPWVFRNAETAFHASSAGVSPDDFPRYDARGGDLLFDPQLEVWTGTGDFGLLDAGNATCLDWTSSAASQLGSFGTLGSIGVRWTHVAPFANDPPGRACSQTLRLYCFEQ